MNVVESFFNTTFDTERMVTVPGTRIDSGVQVVSGARCVIRPVSRRSELFNEDNFGKEFVLVCLSDNDVKANDIVISGGKRYGVQGVSIYEDVLDGNSDDYLRVSIVHKS